MAQLPNIDIYGETYLVYDSAVEVANSTLYRDYSRTYAEDEDTEAMHYLNKRAHAVFAHYVTEPDGVERFIGLGKIAKAGGFNVLEERDLDVAVFKTKKDLENFKNIILLFMPEFLRPWLREIKEPFQKVDWENEHIVCYPEAGYKIEPNFSWRCPKKDGLHTLRVAIPLDPYGLDREDEDEQD